MKGYPETHPPSLATVPNGATLEGDIPAIKNCYLSTQIPCSAYLAAAAPNKINVEPVFTVGSIPETSYNVVKDQKYCGEIKVALTFNPEVNLSAISVLFNQEHKH
ncbi:hypothetical protein JHK87_001570 [Glycine soja]|nr:hypothetical protein JHK87_001570 [Glycine soja]